MHPFPARILVEAKSMRHSNIMYQLDISIFYFYKPSQFQIFFPWKYIKTFPFLVSLLQSTAMQITISVNISICFKYSVWNQLFIKIHIKVFYWFIFSNKNHGLQKKCFVEKSFSLDYVKLELHVVYTWHHIQSE